MKLSTTQPSTPIPPVPDVPYQGAFNALGIVMVFWSFQRLLVVLLRSTEYKAVLEAQSNILRTQTELLSKLSDAVDKLTDAVNKFL